MLIILRMIIAHLKMYESSFNSNQLGIVFKTLFILNNFVFQVSLTFYLWKNLITCIIYYGTCNYFITNSTSINFNKRFFDTKEKSY